MVQQFDVKGDTTPRLVYGGSDRKPTIGDLRAAILASPQSSSYPATVLDTLPKQDLINICQIHAIAVAGL